MEITWMGFSTQDPIHVIPTWMGSRDPSGFQDDTYKAFSVVTPGKWYHPQKPCIIVLVFGHSLATCSSLCPQEKKHWRAFNLRPGVCVGGGHFDQANCFFAYLLIHQFCILSENFIPRSFKVTSPGQVKWHNLKKIFRISPWLQFLRYQYKTYRSW